MPYKPYCPVRSICFESGKAQFLLQAEGKHIVGACPATPPPFADSVSNMAGKQLQTGAAILRSPCPAQPYPSSANQRRTEI